VLFINYKSLPFLFYDLDYEVQTPLLVYPFCFNNRGFKKANDNGFAKQEVMAYIETIRKVNGVFVPIFSSALLNELHGDAYWKSILKFIWHIEEDQYKK